MPFKFDSLTAFLTYPQCDADAQELIDFFNSIKPVQWCRVALEHHEDGSPHRHAVVKFSTRLQSKNERIFDFNGKHPNIQRVRSITAALNYCAKEEHVDHGPVPSSSKREWSDIVAAAAGPEEEWLRVCHEERIQPHVSKRLRELKDSAVYDLDEYDGRPIQEDLQLLPQEFTSLCIVGAPGIGKTGWAMRSVPRPALLVKHLDCLKHFRPGYHKSIVFDDCDFKHLPRSTQLQVCDYENQVQVHVRYGVATIPARVPRLFLCNPDCEPFVVDAAIQGRRLQTIYF